MESDGYFELGIHRERGTSGYEYWKYLYRTTGCNDVYVSGGDHFGVDTTFVGVAMPYRVLIASVVFPGGAPVETEEVTVTAWSDAVAGPWFSASDAWKTVPVHVTVSRASYEDLVFDWTAATANEPRILQPEMPR